MKKLGEVYDEYMAYTRNKEIPNMVEENVTLLKKLGREYAIKPNNHIYHTNIFLMKMSLLNNMLSVAQRVKPIDIKKANGVKSSIRFSESPTPIPIYSHNGKLGYMIINSNHRLSIIPGIIDPKDNGPLAEINKKCKHERAIKVRIVFSDAVKDFDGIAIGSALDSVHSYRREEIRTNYSSERKYVEIPYAEFIRIFMNDVIRFVASTINTSELNTACYVIRTHWQDGDIGKPVKDEESKSIYDRTIRRYADALKYVDHVDIVATVKEDTTSKTITICRVHF